MNWKKRNFVGMKSVNENEGCSYEVVHQREGMHNRYPAILNGVEIPYSYFTENARNQKEYDAGLKKYFALKVEEKKEALILTVVGNPVSCEHDLKNQGYEASNSSPNTVAVYGYKPTVNLSAIGKKGGSVKSEAKTKAARENIKKRWAKKSEEKEK